MIDNRRIGRAIRTLREKAGYTQRELGEKLFVSDMAVSKWETGKSIPDVTTLKKMAVILDMDIDGLLDGTASWLDDSWAGILRSDSRIDIVLYDKPLIDYMVSYFLLAGVRNIYLCMDIDQASYVRRRFRNGESLGIQFLRFPENISAKNYMVIAKPVFLYGVDLTRFMQRAMHHPDSVVNLQTVIGKDKNGAKYKAGLSYDYCSTSFYYIRNKEIDSMKYFSEILDVARKEKNIIEEPMDKGFIYSELDTSTEIIQVNALVESIQKLCGYLIYCPLEIAWRRGMISYEQMKKESAAFPTYMDYIAAL